MSDYGFCWSSTAPEKQEYPTSDLSEKAYQNILGVCELPQRSPPLDYFVASELKVNKVLPGQNQYQNQIYQDAFGDISNKFRNRGLGGSLLAYNPLSLLTGCGKKSSREEEMAKISRNIPEEKRSRTAKISPTSQANLNDLVNNYLRQGKLEEALKLFDSYLKKNPGDKYSKKILAAIYNRIGLNRINNKEIELGKKAFEKAAFLDPDFVEPRLWLAGHYTTRKDNAKAEKVLTEILMTSNNDAELRFAADLLAKFNMNLLRLTVLERKLKIDLKIYPDNADFHYFLGRVYQKKGDLKAANEEFKKAFKLDPNLKEKYSTKYRP